MNAIEIKGVSKQYPGFLLDHINLTLPQGAILGLVGENGAGKSTTIKLLMNAVKKDSGSVRILGVDNEEEAFRETKEEIGVVLDEAYFPEMLTAKNVSAVMRHTYRQWDDVCFNQFLNRMELPKDKTFKDFSRGMKMKLAIAVALSHRPRLLVLDEATSGLDPMIRDEILTIFNDFTRDEEHSILLSSHIVSDLEKICDYIAFLHKGKLIFCEEKDRLFETYAVAHLSMDEYNALPAGAAVGMKKSAYAVETLVRKEFMPKYIQTEYAALETIILFLAKGRETE